jgi:hypothetical protein
VPISCWSRSTSATHSGVNHKQTHIRDDAVVQLLKR